MPEKALAQTEYRMQRFYYEDSDGSIRNGYDTDAELQELDRLLQPAINGEYRLEDYSERRQEDWANNEYIPTKQDKLLARILVVACSLLLGGIFWFIATTAFVFKSF